MDAKDQNAVALSVMPSEDSHHPLAVNGRAPRPGQVIVHTDERSAQAAAESYAAITVVGDVHTGGTRPDVTISRERAEKAFAKALQGAYRELFRAAAKR